MEREEDFLKLFGRESDGREILPRLEEHDAMWEEGEIEVLVISERNIVLKPKETWSNVVKNDDLSLKNKRFFLQATKESSGYILEIPDQLLHSTSEILNKDLFGKFMGGRPNIDIIRRWTKLKWSPKGHLE
ncbi:hypothetical protein KI387_028430, partial [Taxus chinensis]